MDKIKVTVWNEYRHEKENDTVKAVYPNGMHKTIADSLSANDDFVIRTATLDEPQHGLSDDVIADTDVLLWWGHLAHHEVSDEIVAKLKKRVLEGMGFIPLHSAHVSKLFTLLMGTTCFLKWRDEGEKERLWNIEPSHPIAEGIGEFIELPKTEMYGERFDIPNPDKVIFISWFAGGEVFRSGCTWQRGHGRIFYFKPGHETFAIYKNPQIIRVLTNAIRWAKPRIISKHDCPNSKPLEKI